MSLNHMIAKDYLIGEKRRWPRIQTSFKALYADDNGQFREERVSNLSKGGLFLKTIKPLEKGERLELILMLPDQSCEVTVQGQVMYSSGKAAIKNPEHDDHGMGIMFTAVEPHLKKWLGHFIDRLIEADGGGERRTPRIDVPQESVNQITIKAAHGNQSAILNNLSQKGTFIRTNDPLSLFEEVKIKLVHPDNHLAFELVGEVVHIQKASEDAPFFGAGLRFLSLDPKTEEAILGLIREIMFRQKITQEQLEEDE